LFCNKKVTILVLLNTFLKTFKDCKMAIEYTSTKIDKKLYAELKKFCKKPRRGKKKIIIVDWISGVVGAALEQAKLDESEKI
jgi:hypothetical protein